MSFDISRVYTNSRSGDNLHQSSSSNDVVSPIPVIGAYSEVILDRVVNILDACTKFHTIHTRMGALP